MNRTVIIFAAVVATGCQGSSRAAERAQPIYVTAPAGQVATPPPQRTISANGTATLMVVPDLAEVHAKLEVERVRTSTKASAEIGQMKASLLARLKRLGLKADQAVVSHINIAPVYSPWKKGELRRIVGFNAHSQLVIKLRDFDRIGAAIDAAVASGGTNVSLGFKSTKMTELKREVYDMALKAARSKAEQMAAALDVKSIQVRTVVEGQSGGGWYGWRQTQVANAISVAPPQLGGATQSVTPDSKSLTLTISLVYDITQ